ncbi:Sec-independent protein translocase subunit TatA/TatB [Baekduia alba]|uniref:Sec-independent protein translocase subunit TatA/TatB n=1 Tax=Baekduia alba TaxID=2997333 RepID=UPI00234029AA|nr:twin-arginine translocase TatA/TatE family subunit [Baekduia alba]
MELVIVLVIALLVLGPKRLPEAGRGIGRGMREFKEGLRGHEDAEPRAVRDPAGTDVPGVARAATAASPADGRHPQAASAGDEPERPPQAAASA